MIDTDVLIVGAGPTGLTLAIALLLEGRKVMLVDRQAQGSNTSRAAAVIASIQNVSRSRTNSGEPKGNSAATASTIRWL